MSRLLYKIYSKGDALLQPLDVCLMVIIQNNLFKDVPLISFSDQAYLPEFVFELRPPACRL